MVNCLIPLSSRLVYSTNEYLHLPRSPETWLLRPLLPVGGTALLYGDAKVGKSFLALQLVSAIQTGDQFLGFEVASPGPVCYVQLDTPRSLWADRIETLVSNGLNLTRTKHADRDTLNCWPFDALNPEHIETLKSAVPTDCKLVVIDTLRAAHLGEENDSKTMANVIAQLVAATQPAALLMVTHSKKPNYDNGPDILADLRGSSAQVAAVDAILRLTKRSLHYVGRAVEEGSVKVERQDDGTWASAQNDIEDAVLAVIEDAGVESVKAKAKLLATKIGRSEEACRSLIRRRYRPSEPTGRSNGQPDTQQARDTLSPRANSASVSPSVDLVLPSARL